MKMPKVGSYPGIYKAKRLGWDEPNDGPVTKYDILDPYDCDDDVVVGELYIYAFPGSAYFKRGRRYMVNGQYADPKTIESVDEKPSAELRKPGRKAQAKSQKKKGELQIS